MVSTCWQGPFSHLLTFVATCFIWQALLLSSIILYASLPPLFEARTDDRRSIAVFKASVPSEVRTTLQDLYDGAGLGKYVPFAQLSPFSFTTFPCAAADRCSVDCYSEAACSRCVCGRT